MKCIICKTEVKEGDEETHLEERHTVMEALEALSTTSVSLEEFLKDHIEFLFSED